MQWMAFLASWNRTFHRRGRKLSSWGLQILCEIHVMESFATKINWPSTKTKLSSAKTKLPYTKTKLFPDSNCFPNSVISHLFIRLCPIKPCSNQIFCLYNIHEQKIIDQNLQNSCPYLRFQTLLYNLSTFL